MLNMYTKNSVMLFIGLAYCPAKWSDFRGTFASIKEALEVVQQFKEEDQDELDFDWFQIVSIKKMKVIVKGEVHKHIFEPSQNSKEVVQMKNFCKKLMNSVNNIPSAPLHTVTASGLVLRGVLVDGSD